MTAEETCSTVDVTGAADNDISPPAQPVTTTLPLSLDLFGIIAEFLAGSFHLASLASLNVTCKLVREATNAVLWETPTLDHFTPRWNSMLLRGRVLDMVQGHGSSSKPNHSLSHSTKLWEEHKGYLGEVPANCKYVKYLLFSYVCGLESAWMRTIFPNLKIWVELAAHSDPGSRRRPMQAVHVSVHRATSYSTFLRILRTPRLRTFWRKETFDGRPVVHSITFYNSAYLYHLASSNAGHVHVLASDPRLLADVAFEEPSRLVVDKMGHVLQVEREIDTFFGLSHLEVRSRPTEIAGSTDLSSPAETRVLVEGEDGDDASRGSMLAGEGSSTFTLYVRQAHVDHIFENMSSLFKRYPDVWRCRVVLHCQYGLQIDRMFDFLKQYRASLAGLSGSIKFDRCPATLLSIISMGDDPMSGEIEPLWSGDGKKLEVLFVTWVYQRRVVVDTMNL